MIITVGVGVNPFITEVMGVITPIVGIHRVGIGKTIIGQA